MAFERMTQNVMNVSGLPNVISGQATTLKNTFDKSGSDLKTFINNFLTTLESPIAATNIGADVETVATKTLQAILTAFDEAISNRYTKTEADTLISSGTNDLVANVDVNLTTGVITVTKKDGTTETFDTALEKVPARFEIVETNGNYALKITNVDGTSTQTDITNLMNIYNFNNSDTVSFEVIGEGAEKTVVATIRDNSIGLEKLSLTVVSTLEGYMNSAKDSASAAKVSETNAKTSETNAANSASTAVSKAAEATAGATTATTKANEAQQSAEDAEYWAKQAASASGNYILPAVGESQTIETLYGDYTLSTQNIAQETKYISQQTKANSYMPNKIQSTTKVRPSTSLANTAFNITLDGVTKMLVFGTDEGVFNDSTEVGPAFQTKIDELFGENQIFVEGTSGSRYTLIIERANGVVNVPIVVSAVDEATLTELGLADCLSIINIPDGATNIFDTSISIAELTGTTTETVTFAINEYTNTISPSTSIEDFFDIINNANLGICIEYSIPEDAIVIKGENAPTISDNVNLFTTLGYNTSATQITGDVYVVDITSPSGIKTKNIHLVSNTINGNELLALLSILQSEMGAKINEGISKKAEKKVFTATIPTTGWTTGEQNYVDVTVSGILESDYPHITPIYTNVKATDDAIEEAWNKIKRASTTANGLRVYAEETPVTEIPIQIEVVR